MRGEYAIRDWFRQPNPQAILQNLSIDEQLDLLAYEGNAQGFRLLVRNEHHPDKDGMRLTCATLGAFMKYQQYVVLRTSFTLRIAHPQLYHS